MAKCPKCNIKISLQDKDKVMVKTKDGEEMDCVECPQCKILLTTNINKGGLFIMFVLFCLCVISYSSICYMLPGDDYFAEYIKYVRTFWYLTVPIFLIIFFILIPRCCQKYEIFPMDTIATSQSFKEWKDKATLIKKAQNWIPSCLLIVGLSSMIGQNFSPYHDVLNVIWNSCLFFGAFLWRLEDISLSLKSNDHRVRINAKIEIFLGILILIGIVISYLSKTIGAILLVITGLLVLLKVFLIDKAYKAKQTNVSPMKK